MNIQSATSTPNCTPRPIPQVPTAHGADQVPSGRRATTIPDPPWRETPTTALVVRTNASPTALCIIPLTVSASAAAARLPYSPTAAAASSASISPDAMRRRYSLRRPAASAIIRRRTSPSFRAE